jgi:hypothetical protein
MAKNLREAIRWLLLAEEKGYDDVPDTMNDIIGDSPAALLPILTEKAEEGTHHFISFILFFYTNSYLCLFICFLHLFIFLGCRLRIGPVLPEPGLHTPHASGSLFPQPKTRIGASGA